MHGAPGASRSHILPPLQDPDAQLALAAQGALGASRSQAPAVQVVEAQSKPMVQEASGGSAAQRPSVLQRPDTHCVLTSQGGKGRKEGVDF